MLLRMAHSAVFQTLGGSFFEGSYKYEGVSGGSDRKCLMKGFSDWTEQIPRIASCKFEQCNVPRNEVLELQSSRQSSCSFLPCTWATLAGVARYAERRAEIIYQDRLQDLSLHAMVSEGVKRC